MDFFKCKSRVVALALACCGALQPGAVFANIQTVTIGSGVIDFGSFAVLPGCANCTVTIDATTGARNFTGAIVLTSANTGTKASLPVTVTCNNGGGGCGTYVINGVTSNGPASAGGVTMTLGNFTFSQTAIVNKANTIFVGATLTITSRPSAGTFNVGGFTVNTTP